MVDTQQGDVRLFQTNDDGDISVTDGIVAMDGGLETSAYLSLFGGNETDDGRGESSSTEWWGNVDESRGDRKLRSQTQFLLKSIPSVSSNLRRIEAAARHDLRWMLGASIVTSLDVNATIPAVNSVNIAVALVANGVESTINFLENWKASS